MRQSEIDRTAGEHDECERGLGRVKSVGPTDEETDFGVHSLDPAIVDSLLERVDDDPSALAHGVGHLHERGETAAQRPGDPAIEQFDSVLRREVAVEDGPELLFDLIGASDATTVAFESAELGLLSLGQVLGVL